MKSTRTRSNYTVDEIEALVEGYEEMRATRHKLAWLVRYCDLDLALRHMPPKEWQATLLVGLIGVSIQHAGRAMGVAPTTMWRRYRRGLEWLTNYLNGVDV